MICISCTGYKGQKGYKGEKGGGRFAAFSVSRSASMSVKTYDQIITYDIQTIDYGNNILTSDGIFVCDIAGVYYFSFTAYSADKRCQVDLVKNGVNTMTAYASGRNSGRWYIGVSNSIVLSLRVGDRVWLELDSSSFLSENLNSDRLNTFNGYLIHEL